MYTIQFVSQEILINLFTVHTFCSPIPKKLGFSCSGVGKFAISLLFLGDVPKYSGFSSPVEV